LYVYQRVTPVTPSKPTIVRPSPSVYLAPEAVSPAFARRRRAFGATGRPGVREPRQLDPLKSAGL